MKLISKDAMWSSVNSIPHKYPYLSNDIDCDVFILGGGITGAICAYYFAKAGIEVSLADKNLIGFGSTSASTSILQYEIDTNLVGLKSMIGIENAVNCFHHCKIAIKDIESIIKEDLEDSCGFNVRKCFLYTFKNEDVDLIRNEFELRKRHNFDVQFLDEKEAKNYFSFPVKAGILSHSGAGEIDPYRFTHQIINKACNLGVKIYENTDIVEIKPRKDYVELSTENNFKIKARKVIIAAGFKAKNYVKKKIVFLTRSFTVATNSVEKIPGWYEDCIIRDTGSPYTYLRRTDDKRIIIGGEDLDLGGEGSKMSKLTDNDPVACEKYKILQKRLLEYFPNLAKVDFENCFHGLFGETKDSLPYIGEYEGLPNCYFCLGYGSNGILYAVMGAQMLRAQYLGKKPKELELFSFNR